MLARVWSSMVVFVASAGMLCGSEYIPIENPYPEAWTYLTGLSDDGRVALGHTFFHEYPDWMWSQDSGFTFLPMSIWSLSMSGDGSTTVGMVDGQKPPTLWRVGSDRPQRIWIKNSEFTGQEFVSVSDNGLTAVGTASTSWPDAWAQPFIWSEEQGMKLLTCPGDYCSATKVSDDGRVVIGASALYDVLGEPRPFEFGWRWSEADGLINLGDFAPRDLSGDGKIMIGNRPSDNQVLLWGQDAGFQELDIDWAHSITADGQVVIGNTSGNRPAVWDEFHGTRDLESVLRNEYGMTDLPTFERDQPFQSNDILLSDDRKTIGGSVRFQYNFLIRLDTPLGPPAAGDANDDGVIDVADLDLFAAAIRDHRTESYWDVDESGTLDQADLHYVVHDILHTWIGDVDLDHEFSSQDLVQVFLAGEYEDALAGNSTWATGDWNGDEDCTSSDLVLAFLDGGYERGPRPKAVAVPEPSGLSCLLFCLCCIRWRRRRAPA